MYFCLLVLGLLLLLLLCLFKFFPQVVDGCLIVFLVVVHVLDSVVQVLDVVLWLSCVVSLSLCSSVSCLLVCFSVFISSCVFLCCVFSAAASLSSSFIFAFSLLFSSVAFFFWGLLSVVSGCCCFSVLCLLKGNRVPSPWSFVTTPQGAMSQELKRQACCMRSQSHERLWPPLLKLKFGNGWLTCKCCGSSCKKKKIQFRFSIPIPIPIPGISIPIPFSIPPISIPIPIPELELELSCNSNSGIELTPTLLRDHIIWYLYHRYLYYSWDMWPMFIVYHSEMEYRPTAVPCAYCPHQQSCRGTWECPFLFFCASVDLSHFFFLIWGFCTLPNKPLIELTLNI